MHTAPRLSHLNTVPMLTSMEAASPLIMAFCMDCGKGGGRKGEFRLERRMPIRNDARCRAEAGWTGTPCSPLRDPCSGRPRSQGRRSASHSHGRRAPAAVRCHGRSPDRRCTAQAHRHAGQRALGLKSAHAQLEVAALQLLQRGVGVLDHVGPLEQIDHRAVLHTARRCTGHSGRAEKVSEGRQVAAAGSWVATACGGGCTRAVVRLQGPGSATGGEGEKMAGTLPSASVRTCRCAPARKSRFTLASCASCREDPSSSSCRA